jgi:Tfp pilus assembly protein PilF
MNVDALKKMLESGQDNLLLRFGLGQTLLKQGDSAEAIEHLQKAVEFDPQHSAAWKLLGKALAVENHQSDAINAYEQGIRVAEDKGDIQAAKEMKVFLKRLQKDAD